MPKHLKYLIFILMTLFLSENESFAQSDFPPRLEEISLQTDRSLYLSGEPVWFQVYYSVPSDSGYLLSTVLYVELFNHDLEVVTSQKLAITENLITGKILIPEQAKTGYYLIRAYTKYDQNFPVWEMETKVLSVINPTHPLAAFPFQDMDDQVNLKSREGNPVIFHIKNPLASEIRTIELIAHNLTDSCNLTYYRNGLGEFNYLPLAGETIRLQLLLNSGDTIKSKAYKTQQTQLQFQSQLNADDLSLSLNQIKTKEKTLDIKTLNIQSGIEYQQFADLYQEKCYVRIPYNRIGKGLIKFTISDIQNNVQEEFYQYIPELPDLTGTPLKSKTMMAEELFTVDLLENKTANYPFSVSCVLSGTTQLEVENLPAYIIENPWYLSAFTREKQQLSSELIHQIQITLTLQEEQMKNRFVSIPPPFILPEIFGMTVEGNLQNKKDSLPLNNKLVYCSLLGDNPQFHAATTKQDGSFIFALNRSENEKDLYLGIASSDSTTPSIIVKNGFFTTPPTWNDCHYSPDTSLRNLLLQMYFNLQVNQLYGITRSQEERLNIPPSRTIFGNPSSTIMLSDFVQLASTQEVFNELVPYVKVRKKDGHFTFVVLDETLNIEYENPLVLVDQIPYNNTDELMQLQPTELEKIEVISRVYAFGENLFNGIIMITTNDGNLTSLPLEEGNIFVEYGTLNNEEYFSSMENSSSQPNFANTCFWSVIQKAEDTANSFKLPQSIGNYNLIVTQLHKPTQIIYYQPIDVVKSQMGK